jgi:tetratricopeptide (TPR) repeat protein
MKIAPLLSVPLLLLAVLLLFAQGGRAPDAAQQLWHHRVLGKAYFEDPASTPQAVDELKAALALAPDSARDRLNYGLALLRTGNPQASAVELEKVQKQDPKLPHTWFNLGIAYKRLGRHRDAMAQFEGMLRLLPDEPVSHYNLGLLYNLLDRPQDALKEFQTAARLDPKLVAPHFQIFSYYRLHGSDAEIEKALNDFQEAKKAQEAAGDSEDMDWSYWAELYDPIEARPAAAGSGPAPQLVFRQETLAGPVDPKTAGLLVLDSFGDHSSDLLAWASRGIHLYRHGRQAIEDTGLEQLRDVIWVAAGDFDNDGLADLCVVTTQGASLYRNAKGRFVPAGVELPPGRFDAALWMDFDHDYDLDLFLLGENSVLLRNEGESRFRVATERFPFVSGHALAAVAFRVEPDMKGTDLAVSYAGRKGVLYRDRLRGVFEATPLDALPVGARALAAADVDNDSRLDLAFSAPDGAGLALNRASGFIAASLPSPGASVLADLENRGFLDQVAGGAVRRNQGLAQFAPPKPLAGVAAAATLVSADFNGDGRADLAAVAPDGSLHLLLNQTATANRWLAVSLDGVKNLKAAAGAEVEVRAGELYEKRIYGGVPLLFGLGPAAQVDTIRISWANGLVQNEPRQPALRAAAIKEMPRLSGSCPMVFTWDGKRFRFLSDVLGVAPLGASSGDGGFFPVDSDEYLQIPAGALVPRDGRFEIRISEELHEVSYIDQARLIAVDHPADIDIVTNDKFKSPPFPEFRLFGVRRRIPPAAARDGQGRNVLPALLRRDRVYPRDFRRTANGVAQMHTLELAFPAGAARDNRAVLVLNGWIDWADGSTFLAESQRGSGLVMPYLQVRDAAGAWRTVIEDMGVPSGGPKTIAVDLTGKFLSASRDVRIVTNVCLYWDQIFLSEDTAPPAVRLTPLDPAASDLRLRGFSRAILDPRREQPESYDYAAWRPEAMWDQVPGLYTRYGDVRELLTGADDRFVIMGSGDELRLSFDARHLPPLAAGWARDFLLLMDGWSKDADANTAHSLSVEPLPFHGMSAYPYPSQEHFPDDTAHRAWRAHYNTRRQVQLMPPLLARHVPR